MKENKVLISIKNILNIEEEISIINDFNIFEYDSLTKVKLIHFIEKCANKNQLDINKLLLCDTFGELIELIKETKYSSKTKNLG